jgi:hypothetical protein
VFSIKALAMATAVSAGVVLAMPVASQAMPQSAPMKVDTATNSNIVNVGNRKKKSSAWWRRHCAISNDVKCRRHYTKRRIYNEPYYGYRPYRRPGVTIEID